MWMELNEFDAIQFISIHTILLIFVLLMYNICKILHSWDWNALVAWVPNWYEHIAYEEVGIVDSFSIMKTNNF